MKTTLIALAGALIAHTGVAVADGSAGEPIALTAADMDAVSAGTGLVIGVNSQAFGQFTQTGAFGHTANWGGFNTVAPQLGGAAVGALFGTGTAIAASSDGDSSTSVSFSSTEDTSNGSSVFAVNQTQITTVLGVTIGGMAIYTPYGLANAWLNHGLANSGVPLILPGNPGF